MMMELMEVATSVGNPRTIELQRPAEWKDNTGIKEFLSATHTVSREELCKVGCRRHLGVKADESSTGSFLASPVRRIT